MNVSHQDRVLALELDLARTLCESIGSVRALTVSLLIKYKEWTQVASLEIDPKNYDNPDLFRDDYLVTKVLSKNQRLQVSSDPVEKAMERFWAAEEQCRRSNQRLLDIGQGRHPGDSKVEAVLHYATRAISKILGPLTRSKLDFIENKMRFGPGATTSLSGVVTQGKKYSKRTLHGTSRVLPFRTFCFPELWKASVPEIELRESSKVVVVPKKAGCGRTIGIEPDLNIYVQLGIGAGIRNRLRLFGLDLSTQENNQRKAREGSVSDNLVTLDLSSASDTLCREAVWALLPFDWASLLHFARTDSVEVDGEIHQLHKWSSMGNGYTFELETLIFYGVLIGAAEEAGFDWELLVADGNLLAYGDDLIFPTELIDLVTSTLEHLGFTVNTDKTFGKGRFRESCGADYFDGINVRPFFFRSESHDFETICYTYANNLHRWASHRSDGRFRDIRCLPSWLRCFSSVPTGARHHIPDGFGDVGFVDSFDRATPSCLRPNRDKGWAGFGFRYRSIRSSVRMIDQHGAYLHGLTASTDFSSGREALRGRYDRPTTKSGYVLTWPHVGPWQ